MCHAHEIDLALTLHNSFKFMNKILIIFPTKYIVLGFWWSRYLPLITKDGDASYPKNKKDSDT